MQQKASFSKMELQALQVGDGGLSPSPTSAAELRELFSRCGDAALHQLMATGLPPSISEMAGSELDSRTHKNNSQ